jgi:septum site-determining protein MinD
VILAITGGKGGVGKSTVAYNLASRLDAVVVDADLGMADLPTARGPDLHDVLADRACPIEAVREDGPVAILPCGRSLAGVRAADPRRLVGTLEAVEREYGRVLVDCPAGMNSDVGLALLAARVAVLVTTPETVALADAIRARELIQELDTDLVAVTLNRVRDCDKPPLNYVERVFGAPVTPIPESVSVRTAMARGQPVSGDKNEVRDGNRNETVGSAFSQLAESVQSSMRS